jgi:EAL domain-containing protein (putative c-di-GMP-specific phosphodiesterase class I)
VAEDTGLILQLGEWALAEACRQASEWPHHLRVAVNLSMYNLQDSRLPDVIVNLLSRWALEPACLEVEITESALLQDPDETRRKLAILHQLKSLGVRIAMDDFGRATRRSVTCAASFDNQGRSHFHLGRGQGSSMPRSCRPSSALPARSRMGTIAEGVETRDQQNSVLALGCDEAQGYLFQSAGAVEQVPEILASWAPKQASNSKPWRPGTARALRSGLRAPGGDVRLSLRAATCPCL